MAYATIYRKTHLTLRPLLLADSHAAMEQTLRDVNKYLGSNIQMPGPLVSMSFDALTNYVIDEIAKVTQDPVRRHPLMGRRDWQVEQIRQWEGNVAWIPPEIVEPPDSVHHPAEGHAPVMGGGVSPGHGFSVAFGFGNSQSSAEGHGVGTTIYSTVGYAPVRGVAMSPSNGILTGLGMARALSGATAAGMSQDVLPDAPTGFTYLINADGQYLVNRDGKYLLDSK